LSQHPRTVKTRKRNERLSKDPIEHEIAKAKAADISALSYSRQKLKETRQWKESSLQEREVLEDEDTARVKERR
jgi:hypothetical protein